MPVGAGEDYAATAFGDPWDYANAEDVILDVGPAQGIDASVAGRRRAVVPGRTRPRSCPSCSPATTAPSAQGARAWPRRSTPPASPASRCACGRPTTSPSARSTAAASRLRGTRLVLRPRRAGTPTTSTSPRRPPGWRRASRGAAACWACAWPSASPTGCRAPSCSTTCASTRRRPRLVARLPQPDAPTSPATPPACIWDRDADVANNTPTAATGGCSRRRSSRPQRPASRPGCWVPDRSGSTSCPPGSARRRRRARSPSTRCRCRASSTPM